MVKFDRANLDNLNNLCKQNQYTSFKSRESVLHSAESVLCGKAPVTIQDLFLMFASLNYVYACCKYDGYKCNCSKYLIKLIKLANNKINIHYSYSNSIIYTKFYDFIFSFNGVDLPDLYKVKYSKTNPISFDGIRKQPVAEIILRSALTFNDLTIYKPKKQPTNTYVESTRSKAESKININFSFTPYNVDTIIKELHLYELTTTKVTADNIANVIQTLYFYMDSINGYGDKLPTTIRQTLFREIIIESFSVIQCIQLEVGALLLNKIRNSHQSRDDDKECFEAFETIAYLKPNSKEEMIFKKYLSARNNVHLSKYQNIMDKTTYNAETVAEYINYMNQYIDYVYKCYMRHR